LRCKDGFELRHIIFKAHLYVVGFGAEICSDLHRLTQGVYRGIGNLAGIKHYPIPVAKGGFVVTHARDLYSTAFRVTLEVTDSFDGPVSVVSVSVGVLAYSDGMRGAEGYTSLAVNAVFVFGYDAVGFWIITVTLIGALVGADFTTDATSGITFDEVFGV